MKKYTSIVTQINEATKKIDDQKLKRIVYKRLLEDALQQDVIKIQPPTKPTTQQSGRQKKNNSSTLKKSNYAPSYREDDVREEVQKALASVSAKPKASVAPFNEIKDVNWKKYLWVLEIGSQNGIESMTNNEIAYVLGKFLADGATEKAVNNLTFKIKDGFVGRADVNGKKAWRILSDGKELVAPKDGHGQED